MIVVVVVIVATADTAVVVADMMTATVDLPATTIVSDAHMGVVMITDLVVSTAMPQAAAMIATAAVATNTEAEETPTAVIVDVLVVMAMPLQGTHVNPMAEVETKTTALTIGTPVVNCGPLIYSGAERSVK